MCSSSRDRTRNQYLAPQCNLYRMHETKEVKVWALVSSVSRMFISPNSVPISCLPLEQEASHDPKGSRTTPMARSTT
jgi:hypothetical protein